MTRGPHPLTWASLLALALPGCTEERPARPEPPAGRVQPAGPERPADDPGPADPRGAATEAGLRKACSKCHGFPEPELFPKAAWPELIGKMYSQLGLKGDTPLEGWSRAAATTWYVERAPARHELRPQPRTRDGGPRRFTALGIAPPGSPPTPAISDLQVVSSEQGRYALACDMRHHYLFKLEFARPFDAAPPRWVSLASIPHPARATRVELGGGGAGMLVADLGSFAPRDHDAGRLLLLRPEGGALVERELLGGLGRVADLQARGGAGPDALDLVACVFGFEDSGSLIVLTSLGDDPATGAPRYSRQVLDEREGAVRAQFADLNGDGQAEIVALVAQEHEELSVYEGGAEGWTRRVIDTGPHPAWGSNGLIVADMDGDGDLDLVVSNGDTLDDMLIKDCHSLRLFRNDGEGRFQSELVAKMYGVHGLASGDMDGDGDLDLIASAFIPQFDARRDFPDYGLPSLVWFENRGGEPWREWVIERRNAIHATLAPGDLDGDGDLDLLVGHFVMSFGPGEPRESPAWVSVWLNEPR